jgi:hypothetical protein
LKLSSVGFIDAASVDPEISQAIAGSQISTELNLLIPSFKLPKTVRHFLEGDLLIIIAPSM